jgi:ribosomal protein S18 acetylase RimI-like enzyme
MSEWVIRPFAPSELGVYRTARLTALHDHPEAYSSSWEEEREYDDAVFLSRLQPEPPSVTLGAFRGKALGAMAGLVVSQHLKTRHTGTIVAVYVDPTHRRHGLGRAVIEALLEASRAAGLLTVCLTVSVGNVGARRLYTGLGFVPCGLMRRTLRVGNRFVDEEHMALDLA